MGSGENLRRKTIPIYRSWADLVAGCVPDRAEERAFGLWTNLHGIATLVANRSVELIVPGIDPNRLVLRTVARHLAD